MKRPQRHVSLPPPPPSRKTARYQVVIRPMNMIVDSAAKAAEALTIADHYTRDRRTPCIVWDSLDEKEVPLDLLSQLSKSTPTPAA